MGNKKIIFCISTILLLLLLSISIHSQNINTNIEKEKSYKFVLFDNTEITGKVIDVDSLMVRVITDDKKVYTFPKNNILYFTTDITPSKFKYSFFVLGGINIFTNNNNFDVSYSGTRTVTGPNFNAGAIFYLSDSKAIKIDAGFSYLKNQDYYPVYPYETSYYSSTGGNVSLYSLKVNLMLGSFEPKSSLSYYFSIGAGIHFSHWSERTETESDYWDTTWHYNTYTYPGNTETNFLLSLGAGLGYRFSKHFGANAEIEYDITSNQPWFFIFFGSGYFPLRAGISYTF